MKFIGREEELNKLARVINTDKMTFTLVYGRRRVGKSELVIQALKDSNFIGLYYECKQVAEKSNVNSLCDILSETMNLPKLGFSDIESLLTYIFELSLNQKIILVLDEYPYLKNSVKGMDSILQALIDKYKENSKLSLIILGSYVEVMHSLLEHSNPLYGRIDLTINLKQMDYYDSSLFYPNYSFEDKARIYSVFGGIPYYNQLINDSKSVESNIIELIASQGSRLENEISMYLNAEMSKITNANEVFVALSRGFSKYSDILSQSHVSSGPTLIDVLDKLISMEVVTKIVPINDTNNKKKTSYYICDNLSSFYYRYIFKYLSQMAIMNPEVFYNKYIAKDFEEKYVPHMFETMCKQYLVRKNKAGDIDPVIEKIGKYYYDDPINHTNGEFDIVTEDECGFVFYEVKFRNKPLSYESINKEIEQVLATGLNCYKFVFFSKNDPKENHMDNVSFINIDELFK